MEEFNLLGLTSDTNLNWGKKTLKNIKQNCSKIVGILNRLKHVLPLEIKILLYNTLILSHQLYQYYHINIVSWPEVSRIVKIQKKAMQILTLSGYNLQNHFFNIEKNYDLLKLHELKFYFKCMHQDLPAYLLNWKITQNIHIIIKVYN